MTKKTNVKLNGSVNVGLSGRFKLKVNVDPKRFVLTNINAFVPLGKTIKDRMLFKTVAGEVDTLIIDKVIKILNPHTDDIDNKNVEVLIQHPDVMLEGITSEEWKSLVKKRIKKSNPKFTLTNIDQVATVEYDRETEIIEARAMLYDRNNPLSKDRLTWLCSNFGLSYRSNIEDPKRYRIFLIKKLDLFIQNEKNLVLGKSNLERFVKALKDIKTTEMIFYVNELIEIGTVVDFGGIYKVGDRPVGASKEQVINFYNSNPELFIEHKKTVLEKHANSELA